MIKTRFPLADDRRAPIQLQSAAHKTSSKRGMDVLVKACANDRLLGRRSRSPSMNNEEPIALSTYPSGKAPPSGAEGGADNVVWPIEREDFPAPPYYYAMTRSKEAKTTDDGENGIIDDVFGAFCLAGNPRTGGCSATRGGGGGASIGRFPVSLTIVRHCGKTKQTWGGDPSV